MNVSRALALPLLALLAGACAKPPPPPDKTPDAPRRAVIGASAASAMGLRTEKVARAPLVRALELPGELVADPDRSARVASPVAGRLERVDVREGTTVKQGDVLGVVRVPELGRLRGVRDAARTKADAARATISRMEKLVAAGAASEQSLLDARAEAASRQAEARALDEQIAGLGAVGPGRTFDLPLVAPRAGTVVSRAAILGQPVAPEQVLASIVDLGEAWFVARLPERSLAQVAVGAKVEVTLDAYPAAPLAGVVEDLGRVVDPGTRSVPVRVRVADPSRLRVGLFGRARVAIGESEPGLAVPRAAISDDGGKPCVFVAKGGGVFEPQPVELGEESGGRVLVRGVAEGAEIVTVGAFNVRSALLRGALGEE